MVNIVKPKSNMPPYYKFDQTCDLWPRWCDPEGSNHRRRGPGVAGTGRGLWEQEGDGGPPGERMGQTMACHLVTLRKTNKNRKAGKNTGTSHEKQMPTGKRKES